VRWFFKRNQSISGNVPSARVFFYACLINTFYPALLGDFLVASITIDTDLAIRGIRDALRLAIASSAGVFQRVFLVVVEHFLQDRIPAQADRTKLQGMAMQLRKQELLSETFVERSRFGYPACELSSMCDIK